MPKGCLYYFSDVLKLGMGGLKCRLFLQDTVKPLSSEVNTYLAVPVNQAFTYQLAIDNLFLADLIKQSICINTRFPVYALEANFIYTSH